MSRRPVVKTGVEATPAAPDVESPAAAPVEAPQPAPTPQAVKGDDPNEIHRKYHIPPAGYKKPQFPTPQ